jgi:hypothetical protein
MHTNILWVDRLARRRIAKELGSEIEAKVGIMNKRLNKRDGFSY